MRGQTILVKKISSHEWILLFSFEGLFILGYLNSVHIARDWKVPGELVRKSKNVSYNQACNSQGARRQCFTWCSGTIIHHVLVDQLPPTHAN